MTNAIAGIVLLDSDAPTGFADVRLDRPDELADALGIDRDTAPEELILSAWRREGEDALARIDGDYALVVRDAPSLALARDPLGQRPLFFAVDDDSVAVASTPRTVNMLLGRRDAPDPHRLRAYLLGHAPGDGSTFFAGVQQVEPGEIVRIAPNGAIKRSWHWRPTTRRDRDRIDYPAELGTLLKRGVRDRTPAGGVATHLSAGLDSGAVTAMAATLGAPVDAFTAVPALPVDAWMPGRFADESALAALVASRFPDIRHHVVRPDRHAFDLLDLGWEAFEQPLPNPANAGWVDAINRAARDLGQSVMLIGQFGNFGFSAAGMARSGWRARLAGLRQPPGDISPFLANPPRRSRPAIPRGPVDVLRRIDPGSYVHGTVRGWGIDLRDPTADRRLLEFCLTIPPGEFMRDGVRRSLARRAVGGLLPPELLTETRRGYQSADWLQQLAARAGQARDIIENFATDALAADLLDIAALRRAADALPAATNSPETERRYRSHFLRALATGDFIARANRSPL